MAAIFSATGVAIRLANIRQDWPWVFDAARVSVDHIDAARVASHGGLVPSVTSSPRPGAADLLIAQPSALPNFFIPSSPSSLSCEPLMNLISRFFNSTFPALPLHGRGNHAIDNRPFHENLVWSDSDELE